MAAPMTFRSRLAQGTTILVAIVALVALATFVGDQGLTAVMQTAPVLALGVALCWAMFWRPHAEISDDGITLVNVVRTVQIPWPRFASADTRWALTITTDEGTTYSSWAVPAGSGFGSRMVPRGARRDQISLPAQRKLASSGTAEAAALAIAEHVNQRERESTRRADQDTSTAAEAAVVVTANTTVLIVLGALAVLTVLSLALG